MSRHMADDEDCRNRSTSSAVWMSVSAWGCTTWRTPWAAVTPSISSSMENRYVHCSSDSSGRDQSSGSFTTAVTKFSAPMSWSSAAISSASASVFSRRAGSWQVSGTNAPTTWTSWSASTAFSSAGSVGSQPIAPSSVAVRPTLRISVRT